MPNKAFFLKSLFLFLFRLLYRQLRGLRRTLSNFHANQQYKLQKYPSLLHRSSDLSNSIFIFDVEGSLLKSSSFFPYFMVVAFEGGCLLRALVLFLLFPLTCLLREELSLKMMVMVSFFGIKKESFKVGRAVLPKFLLEDVGLESFELLKKGRKTVAVSDLPQVMIESFLTDYLDIDHVCGRGLKVVHGYYVGLMENKDRKVNLEEIVQEEELCSSDVIGVSAFNNSLAYELFSYCREIYLVSKIDKRSWQHLPKDKYPKPLIFHDGRLALKPTPSNILAMFMWVPLGLVLAIIRTIITLTLPYIVSTPFLAFCGIQLTVTKPINSTPLENTKDHKGLLYVCNHRTLLDPLCVSFTLQKSITAVTYSLSRFSEIMAPIKTVRLTRNRDDDAKMMEKLLNEGDLVVCPEGTTCREPYLLRFSPLFAEMSDYIAPVALDVQVSMFYGTTASGLKSLDPLFFLMNPSPVYTMQMLDVVPGLAKAPEETQKSSRYDVANYVQKEIGETLGFECTKLTRRDKYLILAGNEGITGDSNKSN